MSTQAISAGHKLQRAPGPSTARAPRNFLELTRDPLNFLSRLARQYGNVSRFSVVMRRAFLINHPEYIKDLLVTSNHKFEKSPAVQSMKRVLGEGLLTSEGEFHLRQRRLAQPAFHRQRVAAYGTAMVEYAERMRQKWQDGATLDIHREMMDLTLAVVGKTLFDADIASNAKEIGEAMETFLGLFRTMLLPIADLLERLPLPSIRRMKQARARLDEIVYRLIGERRSSGEDRGDLLSMLLAAQDVEGDGRGMTDLQLRDECVTLILAGHETTANALTWTWMLLAHHPEVEARLHAEIDSALAGRLPTVDDLPHLEYAEMVLAESMRLYPPAFAIGRRTLEDHEFGGYHVPADSIVLASQWVMHRDPRYYPDPLHFDPQRWTPEARAARPKFAYFPFGGGPRVCIGEAFAWMEGVLLLTTLAQRWKLRLVPGHPVDTHPVITLRPRYGMPMTLSRRG
jgi:cytochrome P450